MENEVIYGQSEYLKGVKDVLLPLIEVVNAKCYNEVSFKDVIRSTLIAIAKMHEIEDIVIER